MTTGDQFFRVSQRRLFISTLAVSLAATSPLFADSTAFLRGDSNADAGVDVTDAVHLLEYLFREGTAPPCLDAADANDSAAIDLTDAVAILFHLFASDVAIPPPGTLTCGPDPISDGLGCARHAFCDEQTAPDLSLLSDRFDGATLDPAWSIRRPELLDIAVEGGSLNLVLNQSALWFNTSRGPLLHKLVTGDFTVTATVRARSASQPDQPPVPLIHLGGLMARNPSGETAGVGENYIFIVVGRDVDNLSVETKTTVNSASDFVGPSWPSGDAELRICRRGATFRLYKRAIGAAAWTLAMTYVRSDLPATLQVGPVIYGPSGTPDLRVSFDEVIFANAADDASCAAD